MTNHINYKYIIKNNLSTFILSILLIGFFNFIGLIFIIKYLFIGILFIFVGYFLFIYFVIRLYNISTHKSI